VQTASTNKFTNLNFFTSGAQFQLENPAVFNNISVGVKIANGSLAELYFNLTNDIHNNGDIQLKVRAVVVVNGKVNTLDVVDGQIMHMQLARLDSVSLDSWSTRGQYIASCNGAVDATNMSFSFNTTGGGVHISEAEFSVIGKQTINFVRVGNTTAQFINGVAHLYNLDIWTWGRGGINASFSYPSVGITGIASGATSQIFLTYTKYDNGVETREDHPNVPGNVMKLVGSKPLISVLQPDESLHIGQVRIIDIIVQADPQGNIAINSIPIQVNPDMFGSVFLGSGTNIVVKNSDNVTIPTSSTSFDLNHISKITFSGAGGYVIPAGTTMQFKVFADVSYASPGSSLSTSIVASNDFAWTDIAGGKTSPYTGTDYMYNYTDYFKSVIYK
jgi:hypothetical protein